jgi:hypothetical protein
MLPMVSSAVSNGFAITTIAHAHSEAVAEATARWPGGNDGRAPVGEAGDAREAGGVGGVGHAHRREDGRKAARQPRCPRPRRTQQEDVGVRTPTFGSGSAPPAAPIISHPGGHR